MFAEPFSPTVLTISVPAELSYTFNGSPLIIPVTVTGTPVALWLVINTKGQADKIIGIKNGFLGWHYVNKIDTTIYVSTRYEREIGETEIIWDGIDENSNPAKAGSYDYYIWGYDHKTPRQKVCSFVKPSAIINQYSQMLETGEDGLPLVNPLLVGGINPDQCYDSHHESGKKREYEEHGVHFKWEIGGDPDDLLLLQTTMCSIYQETSKPFGYEQSVYYYEAPVFDPHDLNIFYHDCRNVVAHVSTMLKWRFVTGGEAILYEDWLGWDNLVWDEPEAPPCRDTESGLSCFTDRNYIYLSSTGPFHDVEECNKLRCVSFDGEVIFDRNIHSWYFYPGAENIIWEWDEYKGEWIATNYNEGSPNGKFNNLYSRGNNRWLLTGPKCCLLQMIDTTRLLVDSDDETDLVMFENRNGDYFLDVAYQPEFERGWFCNDYATPARPSLTGAVRTGNAIDSNNFNIIFSEGSDAGSFSFAVMTQDGTGIDYMSFVDDQKRKGVLHGSGLIVDTSSGFDGLYISGTNYFLIDWSTYFIAFDSCHGIITNTPTSVENDNPLQFKVEQNSPNPFNPSTAIRFTISENGRVTVDIYNIAGQKIKTLVNDMMKAGTHSVTWDAGKYPSGIYIYKVKSGKFEKTMKMTLVK